MSMTTNWVLKHAGEECTYAFTVFQVKDTRKVLHMGWNNNMQQQSLGTDERESFADMELGV